jgi:predicted neutral ceramidase superfamily lipid hydrolase
MLAFTGLAGFFASVQLCSLGLHAMWIRYPLAVLIAYLAFFASVWLWIQLVLSKKDHTADIIDEIRDAMHDRAGEPVEFSEAHVDGTGPDALSSDIGIPDIGIDLDDLLVIIVIAAIIIVLAGASIYLIWTAPAFLGEVLLDALAMTAFYRRLRRLQREHWALGVFRRTWLIFLITAALFSFLGHIIQGDNSSIRTIGDFLREDY